MKEFNASEKYVFGSNECFESIQCFESLQCFEITNDWIYECFDKKRHVLKEKERYKRYERKMKRKKERKGKGKEIPYSSGLREPRKGAQRNLLGWYLPFAK